MHLQETQCEMLLFVATAREQAAPTQIPQSMKKTIQIPTLNESKTYHLYTKENKFSTAMAMVKVQFYCNECHCVCTYLICTMSGLEL